MEQKRLFTQDERSLFLASYKRLRLLLGGALSWEEIKKIKNRIEESIQKGLYQRDSSGIHPILHNMLTSLIVVEEEGLKRASVISVMIQESFEQEENAARLLALDFGEEVAVITNGLIKTKKLYEKNAAVESENFRKLLMSFAEDVRVILIMIADRVNRMRELNVCTDEELRKQVAREASYLYAPLAHRLGLYKLKSELEDLSLKYLNRSIYDEIAHKLNETKRSRDAYIDSFIQPIKKKLEEVGLDFSIKGRTKSIYSIWNKIRKQNVPMEDIYDLFAIRVILNSDLKKEKADCWQVYSIVTDMYQPNPKRLRDWLSIPKNNGYESLHITVMGQQGKWVEVQIRSRRMDEVAERGLAAHWRYKGIKDESGLDSWLKNVREMLENSDDKNGDLMQDFKLALYDEEVFVFTPKGELQKLPKGATVLDFAFNIHSGLGCKCVGAIINGKNVPIKYVLKSGDQIEILTSPSQKPKVDWLNIVNTSKARNKIKQALKENQNKEAEFGREVFQRRLKNRKIDFDESVQMRLIKKMGYKTITDFFSDIFLEKLDVNHIIDLYGEMLSKDTETVEPSESRKAENFSVSIAALENEKKNKEDVLVIDERLKDVDYKLAKCCSPIYGDEVFGFVSSQGGIKIHRADCKNAPDMISRFGYRIVKACWAGKSGTQYPINLHVVGQDDIGIVTNITSVISKEENVTVRAMSIDSNDGLFQGTITVLLGDTSKLNSLIKKIKTIKGVMNVSRIGG